MRVSSQRWAAGGASAIVVLGAISSILINALSQGWEWWLATGFVVLVAAAVAAWLALRSSDNRWAADRLDRSAVKILGCVDGDLETSSAGPSVIAGSEHIGGDHLGPAAVLVEGDVYGSVRTRSIGSGPAADEEHV